MPLLNSAILAAGAVAIALPIGSLLAVALTKFDVPGKRLAIAALGVLLFLPLYVQLTAWDAALGKLGWYSLWFGAIDEPVLVGMRGAIFIHGVAAIPWVTSIVGLGLSQVDPAQEEAALLVLPPRGVLRRVTLPQIIPFIAAAAIWTIVGTAAEMTVTNIYLIDPRQQTYTERFYMSLALSGDGTRATSEILPGVIGLAALLAMALWMVTWLSAGKWTWRYLRTQRTLGRGGAIVTAVLWAAILVLIGVPLASLITKAGFVVVQEHGSRVAGWSALTCLREVGRAPVRFSRELIDTALVATGAATWALALGGMLGWIARRGGWRAAPAIAVIVLGLVLPGPLVGMSLIQLLNHDVQPRLPLDDGTHKSWLLILYDDTAMAPILAQGIRALPLVTLLVWASFASLNRSVLEAAALDGLSPRRVFWRIALPQRWRAIAAAWLAGLAIAAGDLAWAHLVTPPGLDLLQRRVFGLVHSGVEEQVAAIGLVIVMTYAVLAIGTLFLLKPLASTPKWVARP